MMRAKWAIVVSMVLIGGVVATLLWVNLQQRKASEAVKEAPKVSNDDAKMRLEKILFVEDKHGKKTWELEATSIQQYEEKNLLVLKDIRLTVYTEGGRTFVVSGKTGKINQDTKDMELEGDVRLTSNDGYRLKTESVAYRHEERKVFSSDTVEIEGDQIRLVGKGMQIDMEARTFKVLKDVRTQWKWGKRG
jgi:LPS export ABC transporter protein LptC